MVKLTVLTFMVLSSFILAGCGVPVVDNKDVIRAKKSPSIPYQQLTNEISHPYAEGHAEFMTPERIEATKTYPTTRDCLIESERKMDAPDLRLIDWKHIQTTDELDICLWRIFSSLEGFQSILKWMNFHRIDHSTVGNVSNLGPLEDLASHQYKNDKTYVDLQFRWAKRTPFHGTSPPRIVTPSFWIKIRFHKDNRQPKWVYTAWATTM